VVNTGTAETSGWSLSDSTIQPTHIEHGNYTADVLHHTSAKPFWYYVVHRKESSGFIDLVKFNTYEQAVDGREKCWRSSVKRIRHRASRRQRIGWERVRPAIGRRSRDHNSQLH